MTNSSTVKVTTNNAPFVMTGFQVECGRPVLWVGCLEIKGFGTDNFQTAYEYCVGRFGEQIRYDIEQIQDPTPIQVAARGDLAFQQALYNIWRQSKEKDCTVNLLILQRDCVDSSRVRETTFFKRGFWLKGLRATGRWTFGNDTIVGMNAKTPQMVEDQGQFIIGSVEPFMQYQWSTLNTALPTLVGAAVAGFTQLVVYDEGTCASGDCGDAVDGCNIIYGISRGSSNIGISIDGGVTFVDTVQAGIVGTIQGLVKIGTTMHLTTILAGVVNQYVGVVNTTTGAITWSIATFIDNVGAANTLLRVDDAVSGAYGPIQTDDGGYMLAGTGGEVFYSPTGVTYTRVAFGVTVNTPVATVVNFLKLVACDGIVYAVGRNAADTQTVYLHSSNNGKTWVLDGFQTSAALTTGPVKLDCFDGRVIANIEGDLFEVKSTGVTAARINPPGITEVRHMISCTGSCNDILFSHNNGQDPNPQLISISRTVDGLPSSALQSGTPSNAANETSYWAACCKTKNDESVLFSNGTFLLRGLQEGYLFS